jgi:alpha-L-fucosidase
MIASSKLMFYSRSGASAVGWRLLVLGLALGLPAGRLLGQVVAPADAATAGKITAAEIDRRWMEANAKFDIPRKEILKEMRQEANAGPFRPDWATLRNYQEPQWYKDAKFGIFIHWGVYSVPAFSNEWYPRNMYVKGSPENLHQVATYGPLTSFGYKDFVPMFKAEHYDPVAWAQLFKEAGAQYVVPVAEHHDGFAMYDSRLTDWSAAKMGPHRDLIGELAAAVRGAGLHFGLSSHRAEHDWFMGEGRKIDSDVNDPRLAAFYGPAQARMDKPGASDQLDEDWTHVSNAYTDDWLARTGELVQRYHPELVYFDWWIGDPSFRQNLTEFAAFYYNEGVKNGTGAVINYKIDAMQEDSATLDIERGQLSDIRPQHWQTDTSISNASWGYIEHDTYKSPDVIVHQLIDIVSKNGNLLLNIGPRADGTIPEPIVATLKAIGGWLQINGEAIYGSTPWVVYGEGPTRAAAGAFHDADTKPYTAQDFRFTRKGSVVYAIEMGRPASDDVVIKSLGDDSVGAPLHIKTITLLGSATNGVAITWKQEHSALHLTLSSLPPESMAYVYRVELQ